MSEGDKPIPTHKAIITIGSTDDVPDVYFTVTWDPPLTGDDIVALGYKPQAVKFVERYILPAIDDALFDAEYSDIIKAESPSTRSH